MNNEEDEELYEYLSELGQGGFGRVVKARYKLDGSIVAVKIINKKSFKGNDLNKLIQEANILQNLNHPNIVKFQKIYITQTKIYIQMELVKGGQLKKFLSERKKENKLLNEQEQRQIMHCIISALDYIHQQGIVHRDLKPDDLNDLSSVKIADFGLSAQYGQTQTLRGQCGTLIYMAPEQFNSYFYSKVFILFYLVDVQQVDIWSCAIILFQICTTGTHPLYKKNDDYESYKQKLINPEWEFPQDFPKLAKALFLRCVAIEPQQRYTVHQILSHPWITGNPNDEIPITPHETLFTIAFKERLQQITKFVFILEYIKKQLKVDCRLQESYLVKCGKLSNEIEYFKKQKGTKEDKILGTQLMEIFSNNIIDTQQSQVEDNFKNKQTERNHSHSSQQQFKYQIKLNEIYQRNSQNDKKNEISQIEQIIIQPSGREQCQQYLSQERYKIKKSRNSKSPLKLRKIKVKQVQEQNIENKSIELLQNMKKESIVQNSQPVCELKFIQQQQTESPQKFSKPPLDSKKKSFSNFNINSFASLKQAPGTPLCSALKVKYGQGNSQGKKERTSSVYDNLVERKNILAPQFQIRSKSSQKNEQQIFQVPKNSLVLTAQIFVPHQKNRKVLKKNNNYCAERQQIQPTVINISSSSNEAYKNVLDSNELQFRIHDLNLIAKPNKPPLPTKPKINQQVFNFSII